MELTKCKLGEVVTLLNGRAYLMPELQDSGKYRILRVGNLSGGNDSWYYSDMELDDNKYCESGDLLYAWACNFGPHIWKEEKVIFHYHIWKLVVDKKKINKFFLYYYLLHQTPFYLGGVNGATMVHITKKNMEKKTIYIPCSLETQHHIASILSTYDSLIENNTKRIHILEKMAENLYKEWFVRFRFPGHEKVEMENGLSKGWSIIKIKELSNVKSGFAFKSEWFTDAGCRVAKIKDIGGVLMDTSDLSYVSEDNCKKAEKFILREGDLTIALTGATIGKISIVPKHRGLIYTNQRLGKFFNGDNPIENLPFLYCLFVQDIMVQDIMNLSNSSSAQPNISPEQIGNIKFKGNMDLIKRYNEVAKGFFQEILSLHEMNQNLARQRDLLLPRLMSGKLEV